MEELQQLFKDVPTRVQVVPPFFCRDCKHRQRWECNSKIIQYCGKIRSNRTENKLKKIKVTNRACELFEPKQKEL